MAASGEVAALGLEEELHLIDLRSGALATRAPDVLTALPVASYAAELHASTVEINTGVHTSLSELRENLVALRRRLVAAAGEVELGVAAVGTVPLPAPGGPEITSTERFEKMRHDYQMLVDEQLICGTQVHVDVASRDVALQVVHRVQPWLPVLLALSVSSPYWQGRDSGYASARSLVWSRWPTAGDVGNVSTGADYDAMLDTLVASGVISDPKMAYFDVRPSAHLPTVELRVCDACPLVDDAVLIAGLFRGLVGWAADHEEPSAIGEGPLHRAAMWRAARDGMEGVLLDPLDHARARPAADVLQELQRLVRPQLEATGDWETIVGLSASALARGTSAHRQRIEGERRGRLSDVVDLVVAETQGIALASRGHVAGQRQGLLAGYPSPAGDEALGPDGTARYLYQPVLQVLDDNGPAWLRERAAVRDTRAGQAGLDFGVDGRSTRYDVDLVPRIVESDQWAVLRSGLAQRGRALEMFLRDVYGRGEALAAGVVPAEVVANAPGLAPEGYRLPATAIRAPVMGFDVVRDERGQWSVLEDNVRVPSGLAYAAGVRDLLDFAVPDLPRPARLADPLRAVDSLGAALAAAGLALGAGPAPRIALVSPGPSDSAWWEHALIARRSGWPVVAPADLRVVHGRVVVEDEAVDVLYLRIDGALPPAAVLEVAAAGNVALVGTPGAGVADDKAVYAYVPDLIRFYLGEEPTVRSVPTYHCVDEEVRTQVLGRLDDLVTKPVDGHGGKGVLIGPQAGPRELARRREEILADPGRWIGQELVSLSTHPTFTGDKLEPRHVDLRVFAFVHGTGPDDVVVADTGLTRTAPAGSMVVNSSRGGGAKDTWIVQPATLLGGAP
ncbi:glutamate--cysteine ligase [Jatrophihabitans sp. YIM 134969]